MVGRKNKKGWIKVVEAFMAIMMLLTIVFILINNNALGSEKKYHVEDRASEILSMIQSNDSLRTVIISETNLSRDSLEEGFPEEIVIYSNYSIPGFLCYFRICSVADICDTKRIFDGEVYAKDILVTSDLDSYDPKKLKIFCTRNEI